jgi:hypothetical protein
MKPVRDNPPPPRPATMSSRSTEYSALKDKLKINPRNIPVHIVFWLAVIFLLYMFWKAFSGHPSH